MSLALKTEFYAGTGLALLSAALLAFPAAHADGAPSYTLQDLGNLGGNFSEGFGINASGQVTGDSSLADNSTNHAFLFAGGTMLDLNSLLSGSTNGFVLNQANAISDTGFITGTGITAAGGIDAFLLTPNAARRQPRPSRFVCGGVPRQFFT